MMIMELLSIVDCEVVASMLKQVLIDEVLFYEWPSVIMIMIGEAGVKYIV